MLTLAGEGGARGEMTNDFTLPQVLSEMLLLLLSWLAVVVLLVVLEMLMLGLSMMHRKFADKT